MDRDNRVFMSWNNGSFIVLGLGFADDASDFQDMVEQYGPPDVVEFRAAGEGYAESTWCEDDEDTEDEEGG